MAKLEGLVAKLRGLDDQVGEGWESKLYGWVAKLEECVIKL